MKILAIMGSPRKGNSYKSTKLIEKRLKDKEDIEFEYLFLKDMELGSCKGCHLCIKKGEENCPLDDDRDKIEEKMLEADGVIFVTPIYSFHITALMKNFVDHFSYVVHRPKFFDKKAMIFVQRGGMFKNSIKYMKRVVHSWGFDVVSTLGIIGLKYLTVKYRNKSIKELNKAVDKFYRKLKEDRLPSPSIYDLVSFKIWKMNALISKEDLPADYHHWKEKGWFDEDYYYDVWINPIKKLIASTAFFFAKRYMKSIFKGY